jgi:CubicO group peptidase (beta-lactamase class C family)
MKYSLAGFALLPLSFLLFRNPLANIPQNDNFFKTYKAIADSVQSIPQYFLENASPEMRQKYAAEYLQMRENVANNIVILRNTATTLPYRNFSEKRIAVINLNGTSGSASVLEQTLNRYTKIGVVSLPLTLGVTDTTKGILREKIKDFNSFLVCFNDIKPDALAKSNALAMLQNISPKSEFVTVNFGNITNLAILEKQTKSPIVQANSMGYTQQDCAAQIVMGGMGAQGKLEQAVGSFKMGEGEMTLASRFKYTTPEDVGIDGSRLEAIDRLMAQSIQQRVFPGCQILVAKSGKVFYNKSFGSHEYNGMQSVQNTDLYDIASITKSAATTVAIMKLADEGKLNTSGTIGQYLPEAAQSTVQNLNIRELLTHTSGLPATLPIGRLQREFYLFSAPSSTIKVADGMFLKPEALTQMFSEVYATPVYGRGGFRYSDANFNFLGKIVTQLSNKSIDEYCNKNIYAPMGLRRILFNPLSQFKQYEITPTEQDNVFRHQLLRGYVHDESAALMGGLGGNAGLFANANDLATVFQMLLNKGSYGGVQVINSNTVQEFVNTTTVHHRAYGFDKQSPQTKGIGRLASLSTFGHTGFTGTCAWADPQNELLFIFLSNRVNPSRSPLINRLDTREKTHDIVYQALNSFTGK